MTIAKLPSSEPSPRASSREVLADIAEGVQRGVLAGAAALVLLMPAGGWVAGTAQAGTLTPPTGLEQSTSQPTAAADHLAPRRASFDGEMPSPDVRQVANWVADSRDNAAMDFVIVDKKYAKVYVFDADARLRAASPVLLGAAPGDDSVPGIGQRPIAEVLPEERTTPAGRFLGQSGRNATGEDVVWVDYGAAVSMHRVRPNNPAERRLERLASPGSDDNRISYGCINVPVAFYETHVKPTFDGRRAVIYVLPEHKGIVDVFASSYPVAGRGLASTTWDLDTRIVPG